MEKQDSDNLHEWGIQASRLLELIALTYQTLKLHESRNSSASQIDDYRALLAKHKAELNELMQAYGLTVQISAVESIA